MDKTADHHTKQNKPDSEREMSCVFSHVTLKDCGGWDLEGQKVVREDNGDRKRTKYPVFLHGV